ncbi:MAG: hypothetical protein R3C56_09835 [Pirellulaceae bacterium]
MLGKLDATVIVSVDSLTQPQHDWKTLLPILASESLRLGRFTLLAGARCTHYCHLPERLFHVQTDCSLLELGDANASCCDNWPSGSGDLQSLDQRGCDR